MFAWMQWLMMRLPTAKKAPVSPQPPAQRRKRRTKAEVAADKAAQLQRRKVQFRRNAAATRERQIRAGIKRFRWVTSNDERTCPICRENAGKVFWWDAPPAIGYPGEVDCCNGNACRCTASPVMDWE